MSVGDSVKVVLATKQNEAARSVKLQSVCVVVFALEFKTLKDAMYVVMPFFTNMKFSRDIKC